MEAQKYKIGDKVWHAELNYSAEYEILDVKEQIGCFLYHLRTPVGYVWFHESLLFDTKEECEKYRIKQWGKYLDENGKVDPEKLPLARPPLPDDGKVRVVYNNDYGGFSLSDEAKEWLKDHGMEVKDEDQIPRHNKLLVQCIWELGRKANGFCSDLAIEILKGNKYRIDEYDGWEFVREPDDYDWVTVKKQIISTASGSICGDNRFDIIAKAKEQLIAKTNIESCPEETNVIDSILFRMWQMGWLPNPYTDKNLQKLTWEDVQKIAAIIGEMNQTAHDRAKWEDKTDEEYFSEVLKRFREDIDGGEV